MDMEVKTNKFRRIFHGIHRREYFWLCLIVIVLLGMHLSLVYQVYHPFLLFQSSDADGRWGPINTGDLIFDEAHYVKDARAILTEGAETGFPQHLPLGKDLIIAGMAIFGDNPLGWRIFPILCGVIGVVFFYLLCRRFRMGRAAASLATFFLAFENLTFVQTSVGMLDAPLLPLMTISFWLYARRNYLLSGVFIGLSGLVKLTGFMILPVMIGHWLFNRQDKDWKFLGLMFLGPITFIALLSPLEYFVFHSFQNPFARFWYVFHNLSGFTFANAYQTINSRPWEWITNVDLLPYWFIPHYVGTISLTLWYFIIPVVFYMIYRATRGNAAAQFGLWWFLSTYILWIPLSLLTDRTSFVFYFFPSVGAVCIGLGLAFNQLVDTWRTDRSKLLRWSSITVLGVFLIVHLVVFLALSPFTCWWRLPAG